MASGRLSIYLACIILLTSFSCAALASEKSSVRIVSSHEYGLTLEFTLPPFEMEATTGPDGIYYKVRLPEWGKILTPGHPQLPFASLLIQVPAAGEITLSILDASYETLPGYRIYPAPFLSLSESAEGLTTFTRDESVYESSEFYPSETAVIDSRAVLRGVPVSRLNIYPFQWNPGSGELRYAVRLLLEIRFEKPLPVRHHGSSAPLGLSGQDPFREILPDLIPNYSPPAVSISPLSSPVSLPPPEERPHLRVEIRKDGFYRLGYEDIAPHLLNAGIDPGSINPGAFRMFNRDTERAIHAMSAAERFSPGDSIEFYAQGIDTAFTDINVYRLYWGEGGGKRIALADGSLSGQGAPLSSFLDRLHVEENHTLWEGMLEALNHDYWFWAKLTAPAAKEYPVFLPSPEQTSDTAVVRISFSGRSTPSPHPNHHTVIYLNGTKIGDSLWDGDREFIQEMTISQEMLRTGSNVFKVELPGDTGAAVDIVYLNWIEIEYRRRLEAD